MGLTRKLKLLYLFYLYRRKYEEYRLEAALHGARLDEDGGKGAPVSKEEALATIADPLRDFPDDLPRLSKRDVEGHIKHASFLRANKLPTVWDETRASAALGDDPISRRAAHNDLLWQRYSEMLSRGVQVDLALLKYMVSVDLVRSRIYPTALRYTEYALSERRAGKTPKDLILSDPPPQWYISELQSTGRLDPILKELTLLQRGPKRG